MFTSMYNNITTFIHNLFGTDEFVPLHAPLFIGNEKKYLAECIDTTFVSSVGKFVDRFEAVSYTHLDYNPGINDADNPDIEL